MASLTQWTWVWVNSGSWWWTGRPGVLQFMGLLRFEHDWVAKLNHPTRPNTRMCLPTWKLSESHSVKIFMETALCGWTSAPFPHCKLEVPSFKSWLCLPGDQPPSWSYPEATEDASVTQEIPRDPWNFVSGIRGSDQTYISFFSFLTVPCSMTYLKFPD